MNRTLALEICRSFEVLVPLGALLALDMVLVLAAL